MTRLVAGLPQMYTDKSFTTIKSFSFRIFPVHVILRKFLDRTQPGLTASGKAIAACLPTHLFSSSSEPSLENEVIGVSKKIVWS